MDRVFAWCMIRTLLWMSQGYLAITGMSQSVNEFNDTPVPDNKENWLLLVIGACVPVICLNCYILYLATSDGDVIDAANIMNIGIDGLLSVSALLLLISSIGDSTTSCTTIAWLLASIECLSFIVGLYIRYNPGLEPVPTRESPRHGYIYV